MWGSGMERRVLDLIREAVLEEAGKLGVKVERIILFGSRARGDAREDSDYDILVVTGPVGWRERFKLQARVRRRLYKLLDRPVDLIIVGEDYFTQRINEEMSLEAQAIREGATL
jgi:predicted nucleotidyltransferase